MSPDRRLRAALARLNPGIPADALDEAFRKVDPPRDAQPGREQPPLPPAAGRRRRRRVPPRRRLDRRATQARLIDFDDPDANDWLAVNQFTVVEGKHNRRPDMVRLRQRPAAGGHRAEEPGRRERDHLERLQPAPDLQARRSRRSSPSTRSLVVSDGVAGAHRHADGRLGVVHALAHDRRRGRSRPTTLPSWRC